MMAEQTELIKHLGDDRILEMRMPDVDSGIVLDVGEMEEVEAAEELVVSPSRIQSAVCRRTSLARRWTKSAANDRATSSNRSSYSSNP